MNLLLDTQAFILWTMRPEDLPARARDAVRDGRNAVYISIASAWEMQIKFKLKKLDLRKPPREAIEFELATGGFQLLPISLAHVDALAGLPDHHRDPLDRLLVAQAIHENLTLVAGDAVMAHYPVPLLWD